MKPKKSLIKKDFWKGALFVLVLTCVIVLISFGFPTLMSDTHGNGAPEPVAAIIDATAISHENTNDGSDEASSGPQSTSSGGLV